MKKKSILLILLLISIKTTACSCKWGGNFIKSSKYSDLIIKAKVVEMLWHLEDGKTLSSKENFGDYLIKTDKKYSQSIKIEVIELIKGKEYRKTYEIYGSNGIDCREIIHLFEIGKIYIFGIYKIRKTECSQPNEDINDYAMDGCSEKWLEYLPKTNEVKGYIKGKNRRKKRNYSYEKLKRKIT